MPEDVKHFQYRRRQSRRKLSRHRSTIKTSSNSVIHVTIRSQSVNIPSIENKQSTNNSAKVPSIANTVHRKNEPKISSVNFIKVHQCSSSFSQKNENKISPEKDIWLSNVTHREEDKLPDKWNVVNNLHNENSNTLKKRRYFYKCSGRCACLCIIGSIFGLIILSTAIAAILLGTSSKPNQSTTLSTTVTTITTMTSTSTTSTTTTTSAPTPENTPVYINCSSPTPTIHIVSAYYGVPNASVCNCVVSYCTQMDVTQNVTSYCANNGTPSSCTFTVSNSFFSDSCQGVAKNFWLTYYCS